MARLKCIVVDDELLAREQLLSLIGEDPRLEVIGQADRKLKAIDLIEHSHPDLVFLDIRMPGGGGFEIIEQISHPPQVIFVTAHNEYAIKAFEVNAIDYLLKPVSKTRFQTSVDRVCREHEKQESKVSFEELMVPVGGTGKYISWKSILYIQSEGHYTKLVTENRNEHQVRQTLREWLELLPESLFLKVERSMMINTKQIVSADLTAVSGTVVLGQSKLTLELGGRASQRLNEYLNRKPDKLDRYRPKP